MERTEQLAFTPSQAAMAASVSRRRFTAGCGLTASRLRALAAAHGFRRKRSGSGLTGRRGYEKMRIEKEKAPAGAGTPTEARNEDFEVNHSAFDSITDGGKTLHISDLLHPGAENGIKLLELAALVGEDERIVRRRIQAERKAGKLILSDCLHGYFLPATEQEARRFIRSMSGRAAEIAAVSRAAEAALADLSGQTMVEGWGNV